MSFFSRTWRLGVISAFLAVGCGTPPTQQTRAEPIREWDLMFQGADSRWRGADGAYSVPLSKTRTLWLFGDTWITPAAAKGREGAKMIRNSLAIQSLGAKPEFFWRDGPTDAFLPEKGPGWLWPLSGVRVGPTLYLFVSRIVSSKEGMGFAGAGSLLFEIGNPDDPPAQWKIRQFEIPFFSHSKNGDLAFGTASLVRKEWIYVFGVREDWTKGMGGREMILARTRTPADFATWSFFSAGAWVGEPEKATPLFNEAGSESSVSWLPGLDRFVAVYTRFGLSDEIHVRFAEFPEGPWSRASPVYRCPEASHANYFTYAGKAHPELATASNELIVTYAANSSDFGDHFRDLELYWPRFVRVTIGR